MPVLTTRQKRSWISWRALHLLCLSQCRSYHVRYILFSVSALRTTDFIFLFRQVWSESGSCGSSFTYHRSNTCIICPAVSDQWLLTCKFCASVYFQVSLITFFIDVVLVRHFTGSRAITLHPWTMDNHLHQVVDERLHIESGWTTNHYLWGRGRWQRHSCSSSAGWRLLFTVSPCYCWFEWEISE